MSKYNYIQVYNIWVNGRSVDDLDQHYPIESTTEREWTTDFKKAVTNYYGAINLESNTDDFGEVYYQDYIVILFSMSINVEKFESRFELKFDINCPKCQEMIPYFDEDEDGLGYNFNTVAERIAKF